MPIVNKPSPRRREVRRNVSKPLIRIPDHLDRRELAWAALFLFAFVLVGGVLAVSGQKSLYRTGQTLREPVIARVDFSAINEAKTLELRNHQRDRVPDLYKPNLPLRDQIQKQLNRLLEFGRIADYDQISEDRWALTPEAHKVLRDMLGQDGAATPRWRNLTGGFLQGLYNLVIFQSPDVANQLEQLGAGSIKIIHPDPEVAPAEQERYPPRIFILPQRRAELQSQIEQLAERFPGELRHLVVQIVFDNLQSTQSLYRLDAVESQRRKEAAFNSVEPIRDVYLANSVLAPAGSQIGTSATPNGELITVALLEREQEAFEQNLREHAPGRIWLRHLGQFGFMALIGLGLWAYIFSYAQQVSRNAMRGVAITVLLLLCQAMAVGATRGAPLAAFASATFPTLLAAIVLAIAYDQRFAMALGAVHALIVAYSLNLPIGFLLVALVGVCVAMSQLAEVRTRSKLVRVGFWTGTAMALAVMITALAQRPLYLEGFGPMLVDSAFALGAGVSVGMFVQGTLPTIEKIFKVTTSMTLKELNDASHPLLQRLAQSAPGTYQHSLRLADITEAAAEAIGGNGLLCRVGAMYHDIGKMNKPMYFVENQGGGTNRHAKLSPAMSVLIIVGHVKDGVEMSREYGLPRVIRHFIESHHGTTLVEYFYHAAQKQREQSDLPAPSEFEFRYPGPKPQTKEAAILMLGDSVESAARTLDEPTPARIDQLVHTIAQKRLMDSQFDECNLTLKELHQIETAMTKTLCAVYHSRIKYPEADKHDQPKPGEHAKPAAATG